MTPPRDVQPLVVIAIALMTLTGSARCADTCPSKPGRLILPFGAGASTDIVGRIFAQRFAEEWGQTLIVDNRPGAGGIIGTELAAKSAPDGYTIFTYGINQAITPALAVTSARRAEQLPDVPTIMESGVPDFEVTVWQGYAVPTGTPRAYVAKIHAAMMKALAAPDLRQHLIENGVFAAPMTPEEFVRFTNAEIAKWQKAVSVSGATVE